MSDTKSKLDTFIEGQIKFFTYGTRPSPIQHYPSDVGLEYETVFFNANDGVPIEGWWMPSPGSKQVIICNHPMTFNKGGFPGTQPEWGLFDAVDVDFTPDYKHLVDAGYSVLAYDLRNHGRSGNSWGKGVITTGHFESRDMVGALKWVRDNHSDCDIALYPRCMGANATITAMKFYPEAFKGVKCMVALQPVSSRAFLEKGALSQGLDVDEVFKAYDEALWQEIGLRLTDVEPQGCCDAVKIPTLVAQVRNDHFVNAPKDTQEIFDLLATKEKKLFWIEGTEKRFDGYNYFPEHPEELLGWFAKYFPVKK